VIIAGQNQHRNSRSMEDEHRVFRHDDEFIDLYIGLGGDGTKSKEESINLVKTTKGLQKYVQSYKANNKRLMRAKEKHDDFHVKLMQILEKLEKKMDKDTESSRLRS
jgi:hypothetical protein